MLIHKNRLLWIRSSEQALYGLNNPAAESSPLNSKVFRSRSEKFRRRLFCSKRHISSNCSSEHLKCNIFATAEIYREKAETFLLQIRKKRRVSNCRIYTLSNKKIFWNVECSCDDHLDDFPCKADCFPFKLRKRYGWKFMKEIMNSRKIVRTRKM